LTVYAHAAALWLRAVHIGGTAITPTG
jgi:hypothetical protein